MTALLVLSAPQALLLMGYIVIALVWLWLDRKEISRIDRIGAYYRREHRIMRRRKEGL